MFSTPRKIFNRNNITENKIVSNLSDNTLTYENSISACGSLFYKIEDNVVKLLLIKYNDINWPRLDDFGGKIDMSDESVFDAMTREVMEETNNIITYDYLKNAINNDTKVFYNNQSKYYLWLIRVDNTIFTDTSVFGNNEISENIDRSINWYNFSEIKNNLAFRLLNNEELMTYLESLIH